MTAIFINNITDLKECQNNSFYYFLKITLLNLISKIENPFISNEELFQNVPKLNKKYFQFFWSQIKFQINNLENFEETDKLNASAVKINIPYSSLNFNDLLINNNSNIYKKILLKKTRIVLGEFPLLTINGTFFINKAERIIVQQLIRSPGIYITKSRSEIEKPKLKIISSSGDVSNVLLNFDQISTKITPLKFSNNESDDEFFNNLPKKELLKINKNTTDLIFDSSDDEIQDEYENYIEDNFPHVGELGRININKTLNTNIPSEEEFITIQDIIQINKFYTFKKDSFNFKNNFLNYNNRIVKTLDMFLVKLFNENLELFKTILTIECLKSEKLFDFTYINEDDIEELKNSYLNSINELIITASEVQFFDQINPLSSLSHTRRFTVFGSVDILKEKLPKKLNKIQLDQFGRVCPIETTDGLFAGLITSLSLFGRINNISKIEQPYLSVFNIKTQKIISPIFLDNEDEKKFFVSFDSGTKNFEHILVRKNLSLKKIKINHLNFSFSSPFQLFSLAIALIPFLEHNDLGRMQMAASMEKQAMPLIFSQTNIVGTGIEISMSASSGFFLKTYYEGLVTSFSSHNIECTDYYNQKIIYPLIKNTSLNQKILLSYKPLVWVGEKIFNGQIIAYGPGTNYGELALGCNLNVSYIPWEGYNYEDGIIISEQLVLNDYLTSAHICEYDISYDSFYDFIEFFLDIDRIDNKSIKFPKMKIDEKIIEFRNIYEESIDDELKETLLRIYTIKLRRIQIGDKLAARYGNKGIVTKIVPTLNMPYLKYGSKIDLIFNPLGIPTRMNVGQLFESILSYSGNLLQNKYKITSFNEFHTGNSSELILTQALKNIVKIKNLNWFFNSNFIGKFSLKDGCSGNYFDNKIVFGINHIIKLIHLVSEKFQARKNEKYLGILGNSKSGKSQKGGQRFGEMETWALEAHGSIFTLQEFLTIKSDSLFARTKLFNFDKNLYSNKFLSKIDIPQGFSLLLRELQSIGVSMDLITLGILNTNEKKLLNKHI